MINEAFLNDPAFRLWREKKEAARELLELLERLLVPLYLPEGIGLEISWNQTIQDFY